MAGTVEHAEGERASIYTTPWERLPPLLSANMTAGAYQTPEQVALQAELEREAVEAASRVGDLMRRARPGHIGDDRALRVAQSALVSATATLERARGLSLAGLPPVRVIAASSKTPQGGDFVLPPVFHENTSMSVFLTRRG